MNMASGRMCSSCQACCSVLPIPQINKPAGQRCKDQCAKGCRLHDTPEKPEICRQFECLWLQGWFGKKDRPDKLGLLVTPWKVDLAVHPSGIIPQVMECWPGALGSEKASEFIVDLIRQGWPVAIWQSHGSPLLVYYPDGAVELTGKAPTWEELREDPGMIYPARFRVSPDAVDAALQSDEEFPPDWHQDERDTGQLN